MRTGQTWESVPWGCESVPVSFGRSQLPKTAQLVPAYTGYHLPDVVAVIPALTVSELDGMYAMGTVPIVPQVWTKGAVPIATPPWLLSGCVVPCNHFVFIPREESF
jgi:hypothetical protein